MSSQPDSGGWNAKAAFWHQKWSRLGCANGKKMVIVGARILNGQL
jgi:hypothetical protein